MWGSLKLIHTTKKGSKLETFSTVEFNLLQYTITKLDLVLLQMLVKNTIMKSHSCVINSYIVMCFILFFSSNNVSLLSF